VTSPRLIRKNRYRNENYEGDIRLTHRDRCVHAPGTVSFVPRPTSPMSTFFCLRGVHSYSFNSRKKTIICVIGYTLVIECARRRARHARIRNISRGMCVIFLPFLVSRFPIPDLENLCSRQLFTSHHFFSTI